MALAVTGFVRLARRQRGRQHMLGELDVAKLREERCRFNRRVIEGDLRRISTEKAERQAVATVCQRKRALPEKPPPRIIVLTGACCFVGQASRGTCQA